MKEKVTSNNDVDCMMSEYDQKHAFDIVIGISTIRTTLSLTTTEMNTKAASLRNELKEHLKTTAAECGLEGDKFLEMLNKI